jgi:hypothetical protein
MQYPLKPMSLGEILDTAFKVFTKNFVLLAGIGILMQVVAFGLAFAVTILAIESEAPMWITFVLLMVPLILITPFATAVSTKVIADRYLGLPTGIGSAFAFAFRILIPLLGAILVAGLLTGIGLLCLIIPGVILAIRFSLVGPATVVEQRGFLTALRRSGQLVSGEYGKIFGLMVILWIASALVDAGVTATLGADTWTTTVVGQLIAAVIGAYASTVWTITYFERRCDKEGFDLQLLANALGEEVEISEEQEEVDEDDSWATEQ